MKKERITYLLNVYTSGNATHAEEEELITWVLEADSDEELKSFMLEVWNREHLKEEYTHVDWEGIYSQFLPYLKKDADKRLKRNNAFWWVAAASVLIIGTIGYFYFIPVHQDKSIVIEQLPKDVAPPSGDKAVLILSDGSKIGMDSTREGTIATQEGVRVVRGTDGTITYSGTACATVRYNTFVVPKGSKPLSLVLSDGSKVWLNVGSSLTFPTAFIGKERVVSMEGEAYFEVVHKSKMPFMVRQGDVVVNVLGTHFNVKAYKEEGIGRVTLLEGTVKVKRSNVVVTLNPGDQALVEEVKGSKKDIRIQKNVDLDEVMAWRNGKFIFNESMDIHGIMRQLERWYNVKVLYKGDIKQRFWGSISRDVNLSQVLKILEATEGVRFDIQGERVIVMPGS